MKFSTLFHLSIFSICSVTPLQAESAATPIGVRAEEILRQLTVEEKVAQLGCYLHFQLSADRPEQLAGLGGIGFERVASSRTPAQATGDLNVLQQKVISGSRLGIPAIIHAEGLHGIAANGATCFPQAIGLAATWNPDLMGEVAGAIAEEARACGIRQILSPVMNVVRDARWGRTEETYGEDPELTSRMAVAFCRAVEAKGVIATPKHFVANVGDGGRDSNATEISERVLREVYFPPFEAAIREGGAGSVMAAYNSVNGQPASANHYLLTEILRNEWGFQGFVVSDYSSVAGIANKHGLSADHATTARLALEAGLDRELARIDVFGPALVAAVRSGKISESILDGSVRRILLAKLRLGLFESPYGRPDDAARVSDSPAHRQIALRAARESMVLLKNENATLPLKNLRSLAVLGAEADVAKLGGYSGWGTKTVSVLEGLRTALGPDVPVRFERGALPPEGKLPTVSASTLFHEEEGALKPGLHAEFFSNEKLEGKPLLTRNDPTLDFEYGFDPPFESLPARYSVRWTGKLIASVSGRQVIDVNADGAVRLWLDGKLAVDKSIDQGFRPRGIMVDLKQGQAHELQVEYVCGDWYSKVRLTSVGPPDVAPQRAKAVEAARSCDAAVIVATITEGEGGDRARLDLPEDQEALIREVSATGVPTVVVIMAGGAVTMNQWIDGVPAVLEAWYPGEEGGTAVAEALIGKINPAGRLPITFPLEVGQCPLYYNPKPSGRSFKYGDLSGQPRFSFGHGLSYTTFKYSDLRFSSDRIGATDGLRVSCDVTNTGSLAGDEVVQLYLRDSVASVVRPVQELKAFRRIHLRPGETQRVELDLKSDDLTLLDANLRKIVEPGEFEVRIGVSSSDIRLRGRFEVSPTE